MKKNKLIGSAFFFILATFLPLFKIFLLGEFDSGEQARYIKIYFWIQFLVPVIDCGYYWTYIRARIVSGERVENLYGVSVFGLFLSIVFVPYSVLYALLVLLATITAWYNFKLQTLRIDGDSNKYYKMRLAKVFLDMFFLLLLVLSDRLSVEALILGEFFSVALIVFVVKLKDDANNSFYLFGLGRLLTLDYLYTVLKVFRSNVVRLLVPLFFVGQGVESVLFAVLFYELIAQYFSIEKLRDLLAGKVKIMAYLLVYLFSLPVQFIGVDLLSIVMGWGFGTMEITCVILGGSARIFSVYAFNVIKNNAFNVLVNINIFLVVFAVIEIYSIQQISGIESSAQIALLLFYGIEALAGLSLIIWLERSKVMKEK